MSGTLEDLISSIRTVADNLRAIGHRAWTSVTGKAKTLRFRIQASFMDALSSILGLSRFLLPILRFIALLWVLFIAAIFLYYAIYQYYVPKLLLQEPLYFNYDSASPQAKLNLLMSDDHSGNILSPVHYGKPLQKKFLRAGSVYDFSLDFYVAKSPRNQNIGKFMSYLTVMDKKGDVVAQSARPVIVPYHSHIALLVDQLLKLPYYVLGLQEVEILHVDIMKFYKEPHNEDLATKSVEVLISRSDVDIMGCTLTIYPELSWFTYILLHFPYTSFSVGVIFCFWGLFATAMFYLSILFIVRFIANVVDEEEDENTAALSDDVGHLSIPVDSSGQVREVGRQSSEWFTDLVFDPLSTSDNSVTREIELDNMQRAIQDSIASFDQGVDRDDADYAEIPHLSDKPIDDRYLQIKSLETETNTVGEENDGGLRQRRFRHQSSLVASPH